MCSGGSAIPSPGFTAAPQRYYLLSAKECCQCKHIDCPPASAPEGSEDELIQGAQVTVPVAANCRMQVLVSALKEGQVEIIQNLDGERVTGLVITGGPVQ
jgi:hypothetical protein